MNLFAGFGKAFQKVAAGLGVAVKPPDLEAERAEADGLAVSALGWSAEAGLRRQLDGAFAGHGEDPQQLEAALGAAKKDYADGLAGGDPQLREQLSASVDRRAQPYREAAAGLTLQRRRGEAAVAANALDDSLAGFAGFARRAGIAENGPALIEEEAGRAQRLIDGIVENGLLSPAAGAARKRAVVADAAAGQARAVYDALPDLDAREAFPARLFAEWSSGRGALRPLDEPAVRRIVAELAADAEARRREQERLRDADEERQRAGSPEAVAEGVGRLAAGGIDPDWLDARRDDLPPAARASFERAAQEAGEATGTQSDHALLVELAGRGGEAATREAVDAHAAGLIGTDDLRRLVRMAVADERAVSLRRRFDEALLPARGAPEADFARHWRAAAQVEDWLAGNPQADDKAIEGKVKSAIAEETAARRAARRRTLPLPGLAAPPGRAGLAPEDVAVAAGRVLSSARRGALGDRAAGREARRLLDWLDLTATDDAGKPTPVRAMIAREWSRASTVPPDPAVNFRDPDNFYFEPDLADVQGQPGAPGGDVRTERMRDIVETLRAGGVRAYAEDDVVAEYAEAVEAGEIDDRDRLLALYDQLSGDRQ